MLVFNLNLCSCLVLLDLLVLFNLCSLSVLCNLLVLFYLCNLLVWCNLLVLFNLCSLSVLCNLFILFSLRNLLVLYNLIQRGRVNWQGNILLKKTHRLKVKFKKKLMKKLATKKLCWSLHYCIPSIFGDIDFMSKFYNLFYIHRGQSI